MVNHYRIKQIPEDFQVIEEPILTLCSPGRFTYFTLRKRDYTTLEAIHAISKEIGVQPSALRAAGNKDKIAVTEQACSIKGDWKRRLEAITIPGITVQVIGNGNQPLWLGGITRNRFRITIREIEAEPQVLPCFVNYFGTQRFSSSNAEIGKSLITRRYLDAITLIGAAKTLKADVLFSHLHSNPTDYIGALRQVPQQLLKLYIHAYQSLLWNETARQYLSMNPNPGMQITDPGMEIPLAGFDLDSIDNQIKDNQIKNIIDTILSREGISRFDFILREIPELCAEGGKRPLLAYAKEVSIQDFGSNDLGPGKKCTLSFSLSPGSYATVYIEQAMSGCVKAVSVFDDD